MDTWSKNKVVLGVLALLFVIAGFFLFRGHDDGSFQSEASDTSGVRNGEIEVMGTISCLPYRVATPGQECVKSLKGDDGKVYAFNSTEVRGVENTMSEGTKVTAIGQFEEANTSVDDSSVFRYNGVLVLRTLKTR